MRRLVLALAWAALAIAPMGCGIDNRVAASSGLCGGPPAEPGPGGCALLCRGAIPVRFVDDAPVVTVWIDDKPIDLMLDTGAATTTLTRAAVAQLGLPAPRPAEGKIFGVGGAQPRHVVDIGDLAVGGIRTGPRIVDVSEYAKGGPADAVFAGSLGADVLSRYEVDLDFPHAEVRLYEGTPCPGPLPGWTSAGALVPFGTAYWGRQAVIPVSLDGQPLQAVIDSGAVRSSVSVAFARRLQVPAAELASELSTVSVGFGPDLAQGRLHQFRALQVGPETLPLFEADVLDLRLPGIDMLLGDDYLRQHKMWLSFARHEARVSADW